MSVRWEVKSGVVVVDGFAAEGAESAEGRESRKEGVLRVGRVLEGEDFGFLTALRCVRNDRYWGVGTMASNLSPQPLWIPASAGMTIVR